VHLVPTVTATTPVSAIAVLSRAAVKPTANP
jgi:hypothetical protein